MFGCYKFLHSRHVDLVVAGKLRFTSFDYIRFCEDDRSDCWIGDRFEGIAETRLTDLTLDGINDNDAVQRLKKYGLMDLTGTVGCISGSITVLSECGPRFVFCFSNGDFGQLADIFLNHALPGQKPYDACIQLMYPRLLAQAVWETGIVAENGKRVSECFRSIEIRRVHYRDPIADLKISDIIEASPYQKREIYSAQNEMRIVLEPIDSKMLDTLSVLIDRPDMFFKVIRRATLPPQLDDNDTQDEPLAVKISNFTAEVDTFMHVAKNYSTLDNCTALKQKKSDEFSQRYWPQARKLYWNLRLNGRRTKRLDEIFGARSFPTHAGVSDEFLVLCAELTAESLRELNSTQLKSHTNALVYQLREFANSYRARPHVFQYGNSSAMSESARRNQFYAEMAESDERSAQFYLRYRRDFAIPVLAAWRELQRRVKLSNDSDMLSYPSEYVHSHWIGERDILELGQKIGTHPAWAADK